MRITRDALLRVARETAQKFALKEPGLVAAYLSGSLRGDDPFIGNSTDIDIVLVHESKPSVRREIQPLTPEIHLDISHTCKAEFDKPKTLRTDPWLGPELYDPLPLYGKQLFFEFVQAGVRAGFDDPVNILARARHCAGNARLVWTSLATGVEPEPANILAFLKSVRHAVHAIALLSDSPLTERRFLLQFGHCAATLSKPEMSARLMEVLGGASVEVQQMNDMLAGWETTFSDAAGREKAHASISSHRLGYYRNAFSVMLAGDFPHSILWPLLHTWSLAALAVPPTHQAAWRSACETLGLSGDALDEKVGQLDSFIDSVEDALDGYATDNGI
jgi:hypothetical protein